jgi:hypothetical protein
VSLHVQLQIPLMSDDMVVEARHPFREQIKLIKKISPGNPNIATLYDYFEVIRKTVRSKHQFADRTLEDHP